MLQRQIMFKQLQEQQRRQQLQELNNTRNQNYVNQLSSLKQASGSQFPPTVNREPFNESSHMFMLGNMQMMQHGGASLPNGSVLPQSHHYESGQPQFDMALYGTSAPNANKNLNQYSLLQEPSDMGRNNTLGMSAMQPSDFASSFMSQRGNFSSDQISAPDGSLLPNQMFQEKNLFGQVPFQNFDSGILPGGYSQQGITTQRNTALLESDGRHNDTTWLELSQPDGSLDPLEQKILYSTDDSIWESSFSGTGKMGTKEFENTVEHPPYMDGLPSLQSGSWSALMQSAVAEMSGSDNRIQEEWSGLSFQNPEPSTEKPYFINNEKPQNNWVDRNLQNESSPSSKPENSFEKSNMNSIIPGFPQSGHQYLKQNEEFHSQTSSHASMQHSPRSTNQSADYNSQQKHPIRGSQLIQTSVSSPSIWPDLHNEHAKSDIHQPSILSRTNDNQPSNYFSGHELGDKLWLHQSTSHHVAGGIQKPFDQVNQPNIHSYSTETDKLAPGDIVEPMSTLMGASSDSRSQNVTAQSENPPYMDDISNNHTSGMQWNLKVSAHSELPLAESSVASLAKSYTTPGSLGFGFTMGPADPQTPQSYSFFPSFSKGNSSVASLSSHNVNEYIKNQDSALPSHMASKYPMGRSSQRTDMITQRNVSSPTHNKLSNFFSPPDSASSSIETSSGAPNEQHNQRFWKHEHNNVHEFGTHSGKSEYLEKQLQTGCSLPEGLTEINNAAFLSRNTQNPESFKYNHPEADSVASGTVTTLVNQQRSSQAEKIVNDTPAVLARDIGAFGHSLSPNYSLLHQVPSPRKAETDKILLKNDGVDYQQAIAKVKDLSSGENSGVKDAALKFGASSPGNKEWNFSQKAVGDRPGKDFSTAYFQNFQPMDMLGQNNVQNHSIGINEASNVTYPSHMSPQMASSLFKLYGTLKNGQMLPVHNSKAAISAAQPFSKMSIGNLQENSLIMQVSSDNACQSVWPSTAATSVASKQETPSILPLDICYRNLVPSVPKKRKMVAFDMVPWYKEVNSEPSKHLNTNSESMAELEWAQASNRRQEEVKNEAEIVEDVLFPGVRPKRRLIFATQLMQQVFRPPPASILCADVGLNFDSVVYAPARLTLGDACRMARQSPPGTTDVSPDELKISNKTDACDYSKVVEVLVSRVEKLDGDISRLEKSSSIVDIKVMTQELEKFSMLNRFAKCHIKVNQSTVDPASTNVQKTSAQRYVVALPMPRTVPEGIGCISL